jgi:HK97 family phage major capsid protein
MDRLRKLRAERHALLQKAKDLAAVASKDVRNLSEDELAEIDKLKASIGDIDKQIQALEAVVELERTAPASKPELASDPEPKPKADGDGLPNITGGHDRSLDDPYRGFPKPEAGGMGQFLFSVIEAGRQGRPDPVVRGSRETRLAKLTAAAGADEHHGDSQKYGGFTVPVGFTARLLMLEMEDDPTQGITTIPMGSPTVKIPARVDKNHSSSVAGGITVAWGPQTAAIASSRMELEQIMLSAESLKGISYVSEELLSDSAVSFAALLEAGFRDAVTDAIIRARVEGVGAGEPLGILNSPALISVSTTSQTTGTITGANIMAMRSRVWRYSRAVWLANHDTYEQIASAHVAGSNSDVFLFSPGRGIDVPDTLLGRPIIFTEYAKSLSTVGDIMCVNWGEYLVGTLQGVQMAESMHVRFENNERAFRVTIRQAGTPWWRSTLTPVNSTTTLSPYVALQTRTT